MKKLLAMFLAMMLFAVPAFAAEWGEGLSPAKPYPSVPEVDLTSSIGYMQFYPNAKAGDNALGQKTLFIYLPREDVQAANNGSLILRSADRGEEWRVTFSNKDYIRMRPISEFGLEGLMWGSGVCFEIMLPVSPRLGASYTVELQPLCIVDAAGTIGNPAITDTWAFEAFGDYGVSELEYRRPKGDGQYEGGIGQPKAGDEIRFDLVLGGDAVLAALYVRSGAEFVLTNFTESCEVIGTALDEDPYWGVIFLDADGEVLQQVEF